MLRQLLTLFVDLADGVRYRVRLIELDANPATIPTPYRAPLLANSRLDEALVRKFWRKCAERIYEIGL
jgi:hypothetical protein